MPNMLNWFLRHLVTLTTILFGVADVFVCYYMPELVVQNLHVLAYIFAAQLIFIGILTYYYTGSSLQYLRDEIEAFLFETKYSPLDEKRLSFHPDVQRVGKFTKKSLEVLSNFKEELKSGRELKSEIELAAEIQKHVLEKKETPIPSLQIIAKSKSATEVGGDSYDIIERNNNYYIYLGDVTGHGVAAGFVMMMVNALISGFSRVLISSAQVLASTNEILKPRIKSNMLMTLLMLRWNEREKQLFMTGAGHEHLLIYKKAEDKVFRLRSWGVPLGVTKNAASLLKEIQLDFQPGDLVVMYTDGITEAKNSTRQDAIMFGLDRLVEVIEKAPEKNAPTVFKQITIELSKFLGYKNRQLDDITLMVIHYHGADSIPHIPIPPEQITEWNWNV